MDEEVDPQQQDMPQSVPQQQVQPQSVPQQQALPQSVPQQQSLTQSDPQQQSLIQTVHQQQSLTQPDPQQQSQKLPSDTHVFSEGVARYNVVAVSGPKSFDVALQLYNCMLAKFKEVVKDVQGVIRMRVVPYATPTPNRSILSGEIFVENAELAAFLETEPLLTFGPNMQALICKPGVERDGFLHILLKRVPVHVEAPEVKSLLTKWTSSQDSLKAINLGAANFRRKEEKNCCDMWEVILPIPEGKRKDTMKAILGVKTVVKGILDGKKRDIPVDASVRSPSLPVFMPEQPTQADIDPSRPSYANALKGRHPGASLHASARGSNNAGTGTKPRANGVTSQNAPGKTSGAVQDPKAKRKALGEISNTPSKRPADASDKNAKVTSPAKVNTPAKKAAEGGVATAKVTSPSKVNTPANKAAVEGEASAKGAASEGDDSAKGAASEGDAFGKGAASESDAPAKGGASEGVAPAKGAAFEGDDFAKGAASEGDDSAKGDASECDRFIEAIANGAAEVTDHGEMGEDAAQGSAALLSSPLKRTRSPRNQEVQPGKDKGITPVKSRVSRTLVLPTSTQLQGKTGKVTSTLPAQLGKQLPKVNRGPNECYLECGMRLVAQMPYAVNRAEEVALTMQSSMHGGECFQVCAGIKTLCGKRKDKEVSINVENLQGALRKYPFRERLSSESVELMNNQPGRMDDPMRVIHALSDLGIKPYQNYVETNTTFLCMRMGCHKLRLTEEVVRSEYLTIHVPDSVKDEDISIPDLLDAMYQGTPVKAECQACSTKYLGDCLQILGEEVEKYKAEVVTSKSSVVVPVTVKGEDVELKFDTDGSMFIQSDSMKGSIMNFVGEHALLHFQRGRLHNRQASVCRSLITCPVGISLSTSPSLRASGQRTFRLTGLGHHFGNAVLDEDDQNYAHYVTDLLVTNEYHRYDGMADGTVVDPEQPSPSVFFALYTHVSNFSEGHALLQNQEIRNQRKENIPTLSQDGLCIIEDDDGFMRKETRLSAKKARQVAEARNQQTPSSQ